MRDEGRGAEPVGRAGCQATLGAHPRRFCAEQILVSRTWPPLPIPYSAYSLPITLQPRACLGTFLALLWRGWGWRCGCPGLAGGLLCGTLHPYSLPTVQGGASARREGLFSSLPRVLPPPHPGPSCAPPSALQPLLYAERGPPRSWSSLGVLRRARQARQGPEAGSTNRHPVSRNLIPAQMGRRHGQGG